MSDPHPDLRSAFADPAFDAPVSGPALLAGVLERRRVIQQRRRTVTVAAAAAAVVVVLVGVGLLTAHPGAPERVLPAGPGGTSQQSTPPSSLPLPPGPAPLRTRAPGLPPLASPSVAPAPSTVLPEIRSPVTAPGTRPSTALPAPRQAAP
jgi:hypothetical protein